MTQGPASVFSVTDLGVISADVHMGSENAHPVIWDVNFAEREDEGYRFASGWFHAASDGIQVTVSIGAVLNDTGVEYDRSDVTSILEDDYEALNTMYQYARSAARVLIALTDSDFRIPPSMPSASVAPFPDVLETKEGLEDDSQGEAAR